MLLDFEDLFEEGDKDRYWEAVLPEIEKYLDNQIFLIRHREYWDPVVNEKAIRTANLLLLPNLEGEEMGTVAVKALGRRAAKKIVNDPKFQEIVYNTPHTIGIPHIFLPIPIFSATVYAWKQERIFSACVNEIVRRLREDEIAKNTFGALINRQDAMEFLRKLCNSINNQTGEDFLQDWLGELLEMPFPTQVQSLELTDTVIQRDVIDDGRRRAKEVSIGREDAQPVKILSSKSPQPDQIEEPITNQQKGEIEAFVAKIGLQIIEYRMDHSCANTHGENKILSQALGYHRNTISKYVEKINQNQDKIMKILTN